MKKQFKFSLGEELAQLPPFSAAAAAGRGASQQPHRAAARCPGHCGAQPHQLRMRRGVRCGGARWQWAGNGAMRGDTLE